MEGNILIDYEYSPPYCFGALDFCVLVYDNIFFMLPVMEDVKNYYDIDKFVELCANHIIIPTANFDIGLGAIAEGMSEEDNKDVKRQIPSFYRVIEKHRKIIFNRWEDSDFYKLGRLLMSLAEDISFSDINDRQFREIIKEIGKNDPYLKLENEIKELDKICSDFSIAINTDLFKTKILDSSLLIRLEHLNLWNYQFSKHFPDKKGEDIPMDTVKTIFKHNMIYPKYLTIDEIIEYRKDKANVHFRKWLLESISRIKNSQDILKIDDEIKKDFEELSLSYKKQIDNRTNIVSATLTGLGSVIASLGGIIPAIITACSLPWISMKASNKAVKSFLKKYSKDNWALFFIEWKQTKGH